MWSSWVKTNNTTQVMYIAKLKDGPKRATKFSQMILERVFEMVWWRGRKWAHTKRILRLQCFSPLKKLTSHFYFKRLLELFFFFLFVSLLFFNTFSHFFPMLRLFEDSGILMIYEGENTLQKFLFRWNGMEWLSHDYENGGVVDISTMDAYSGMELYMPIFLGGASK
jgi:hypothetical protein